MVLSDHTFPPDIRVEKEIGSLQEAGHDIGLVCLELKGEGKRDSWHGVPIWRMKMPLHSVRMVGRLLDLWFLRHRKRKEIRAAAREFGPDAIHVHDLPLALASARVAKELGVPLVADFHEHYPALIKDKVPRFLSRYVFKKLLAEEGRVVDIADAVITVAKENVERIKRSYGKSKVYEVTNGADLKRLDKIIYNNRGAERDYDLCYVGGITADRGLLTVINALGYTEKKLRMVVVGEGRPRSALEERVRKLGIDVRFTGWLDFEEAMTYLLSSKIGVVPHSATVQRDHTLPHKLFQCMALSTPVLASDITSIARVVRACRCGKLFDTKDARSCARAMDQLMEAWEDGEIWNEMGGNGRSCVKKRYSWERCGRILNGVYSRLEKREK